MRPARAKRWVVREGDGSDVAAIVRRMGEDPALAIAEGRLFVGPRRVSRGDQRVGPGDEIRVGRGSLGTASRGPGAPRVGAAPASRDAEVAPVSAPSLAAPVVLFERGGVLACVKPAGMPTVPDHDGASSSLVSVAARESGHDPADLRVTSRLDREVSGVVLFATTPAAEERLRVARAEGLYTRRYVALGCGAAALRGAAAQREEGVWREAIGRGRDPRHRAVAGLEAKAAETRWRVVAVAADVALLALRPITGRTHQLRVHASHAGAPLFGDRDYRGPTRLTLPGGAVIALDRVALHAARVTVPGPDGEALVVSAPIPDALLAAWGSLGGAAEAWNTAVSCDVIGGGGEVPG